MKISTIALALTLLTSNIWTVRAENRLQSLKSRREFFELKPTLDEFKKVTKQLEQAAATKQPPKALAEKRDELLARYQGKFRELMLYDLDWIKREKQ